MTPSQARQWAKEELLGAIDKHVEELLANAIPRLEFDDEQALKKQQQRVHKMLKEAK